MSETTSIRSRYPVLADCLWRYADIEASELWMELADEIRTGKFPPAFVAQLRAELFSAIRLGDISPRDYDALTNDDERETTEAVRSRLIELWHVLFGEGPVTDQ